METKTDILNELKSLSPLIAGMNKVNLFTVPQGYFDSVSKTVLACLKEEHNIINLPENKQAASVPKGYFDYLPTAILNRIRAGETAPDEIRNLSSLLYAIQNINVFKVPDGYFTNLSDTILRKVQPQLAKVADTRKRNLFIKYAVAAMMTGVVALSLYKFIDQRSMGVTNDNTVATLDASIEKGKKMNDTQFNEALENLAHADIAKYLEKNGDISDVAVLRNNIEESILPSQEDYLLDETTLENYLKKIEKITLNN